MKPQEILETAAAAAARPGYKTTEFWLSAAAAVMGIVLASGALPDTGRWTQAVGLVVSALTALGYTAQRGMVKRRL